MKTISDDITNEVIIKNSRFITLLFRINDDSDILDIISRVKKDYPKATHYCYGYITESYKKSSDDGEPGGTAGVPILSTLEKEDIVNVLAVVVRYFGGIKLGAGGLVRAYTKGVKEALNEASLVTLVSGYKLNLLFSYSDQKNIDYILKDYEILDKKFLDKITYTILIPKEKLDIIDSYEYEIEKELLIKQ